MTAPLNIVLCFPVEQHHVDQMQNTLPSANIINAGQSGVNDALPQADIFCGHAKVPVDWKRVVNGGRLKWIQSSAAGLDHCLVPEVIDSPIVVSSASGLFADQVAEQTMAILFSLIRSMKVFHNQQQAREFVRRPTNDLHGKTVGIVGFGGNGRRIAEVLAPFRVRILATDLFPNSKPDHVEQLLPADDLPTLLKESDIVILCIPLNKQTDRMFDKSKFAAMKSNAIFVNVARGQCVKECDLVDAIQSGQLSAAGLDVTESEPLPVESPLWDHPNVIITPHVGAQSAIRVDTTVDMFCTNLKRFLRNEPPINVVDKSLGFPVPTDWER